jgi:branched-chain amino acid transport system ATP-binding protein
VLVKLENVKIRYGNVEAVSDVSFGLEDGDFVTLLGANGAGKSSILRALSGLIRPASGRILFDGRMINGVPPHIIVAQGMTHVPEGRRVFPLMTTYENLKMGGYVQRDNNEFNKNLRLVYNLFPRLEERARQAAGTLSGGEQQMLAIGRSMMSSPRVILMDEPSIGLAPLVVTELAESIVELNRRGISIILVEQNATMALGVSRWGYVMETGRIVLSGPSHLLANDKSVREIYLGQ